MKKIIFTSFFIIFIVIASFLLFKKDPLIRENSLPVYFSKKIQNKHITLPVRRPFNKDSSKLSQSISFLLEGPNSSEIKNGYFSEIPKETRLINITENDKSITVNFSEALSVGGGAQSMRIRLEQLVYTLIDNAPNRPIYIKINGKKIKTLGGEGIEIPQPLNKNINKSMDI